jgi:hypothetical protein
MQIGIHGTIYHTQLKLCSFIQPLAFYEMNLRLLSWQNMTSGSFLQKTVQWAGVVSGTSLKRLFLAISLGVNGSYIVE